MNLFNSLYLKQTVFVVTVLFSSYSYAEDSVACDILVAPVLASDWISVKNILGDKDLAKQLETCEFVKWFVNSDGSVDRRARKLYDMIAKQYQYESSLGETSNVVNNDNNSNANQEKTQTKVKLDREALANIYTNFSIAKLCAQNEIGITNQELTKLEDVISNLSDDFDFDAQVASKLEKDIDNEVYVMRTQITEKNCFDTREIVRGLIK